MNDTQPTYLEMSDEELLAVDTSSFNTAVVEPVQEDSKEANEVSVPVAKESEDEQENKDSEDSQAGESAPDVDAEEPATVADVDYKAAYEKLFTPFKANGKEIAISNVDDAISLMQMGANYNKKMAALKPNLKLMKLLENNGLLNEEKLGFLIDLEKKNPNAINKLVKDSGLDPMDLDADSASGYVPNTYTVDDKEMELDSVLDEIQGTPTYTRTLDVVSAKWDQASKQVIVGSPQLLKVINAHIQSGIYDTIQAEVDNQRVYGRLQGLSDIEAYRQVGDAIEAKGGFNSLVKGSSQNQEQLATQALMAQPKPSKAEEDKLRDKKRAASSTKPAGSNSVSRDFNPLGMSDEEFSKQAQSKFL